MPPRSPLHAGLALLAVILGVLPLLLVAADPVFRDGADCCPRDDHAVLEIGVLQARRGGVLLGPYSRFHWNHPGPVLYYLLLPVYLAAGRTSESLHLGALLLNAAAAVAIVLRARASFGLRGAFAAAGAVALFLATLGPSIVADSWNPYVTLLPYGLFLLLAAALAVEGVRLLPHTAVIASAIVQTHIMYLPLTGLVGLAALLLHAATARGRNAIAPAQAPGRASVSVALLVLVGLWTPPLIEQLRSTPGNLQQLVVFFRQGTTTQPIGLAWERNAEAMAAAASTLRTLFAPHAEPLAAAAASSLALVLMALAPAAAALLWRRDPHLRALGVTAVTASLASLGATLSVQGPLHWYLVFPAIAAGLAVSVAVLAAAVLSLPERLRRPAARLSSATAVGVAVLASMAVARALPSTRPVSSPVCEDIDRAAAALGAHYHQAASGPLLFRLSTDRLWGTLAAVMARVHRADVPISVEDGWLFMFGAALAEPGGSHVEIVVGDDSVATEAAQRPDMALLTACGAARFLTMTDPGYLERHRWKNPLAILEKRGVVGDAAVLADGEIPPDGTAWDAPGCLQFADTRAAASIAAPPGMVLGLVVSADGNDEYDIACSDDGTRWAALATLPTARSAGTRRRVWFSPELARCRALRIAPSSGDAHYSVCELGVILK